MSLELQAHNRNGLLDKNVVVALIAIMHALVVHALLGPILTYQVYKFCYSGECFSYKAATAQQLQHVASPNLLHTHRFPKHCIFIR